MWHVMLFLSQIDLQCLATCNWVSRVSTFKHANDTYIYMYGPLIVYTCTIMYMYITFMGSVYLLPISGQHIETCPKYFAILVKYGLLD